MFLTAALLDGVRHGFSTREGGVSIGAFASLNLGRKTGDDEANVAENHRRLRDEAGYAALVTPDEQVHGDRIVEVRDEGAAGSCDALVAPVRGPAVGVRVADCVPVLLWDPASGVVAAIHAGWRGVAGSIVPKTVDALRRRFGASGATMRAAIGPAIGDCYEVDDATADKIASAVRSLPLVPTRAGHVRIDLRAAVRSQLESAGVSRSELVGGCTACEPARFFSHRRDKGRTGRHLAFIGGGA